MPRSESPDYVLDHDIRDEGYSEVPARRTFGDETRVLFRTFKSGNTTFAQYRFSIRVGRYHTDLSAIDVNGFLTYSQVEVYAQQAFNRLHTGSAGGVALAATS